MDKIVIVGPGRVGESTAQNLAKDQLCRELVLIGLDAGQARGVALDIQESAPLFEFDTEIRGGADPALMRGADLVIITAGLPRKPGMSRLDLLAANRQILAGIAEHVARYAYDAFVLVVSNPVDLLTFCTWQKLGWARRRVFGLSGVLDSARMASFVARESGFSVRDISAMVIGGHGDAMVPLLRYTTIAGVPLSHFLNDEARARVVEKTRQGGAEIVALKKTSSAYDAPAAAVAAMVDAIVHDRKRLMPCVAVLEGEYGMRGLALGVPTRLGRDGVEKVVELPLTEEEQAALAASAQPLRDALAGLPD
ncbi:MAG TPA: malate dehydrogenase [Gammaproteobacteria bacterium]|nr:malate dehydrogenase [Gammaproteobacteria bacterium]